MQSSQSMAAALQQAGLAAGPVPGWAGLQGQQQRPTDQGAALLAHLQNQARTSMGQMRPQEPSGEHLLLRAACVAIPKLMPRPPLKCYILLLLQGGFLHKTTLAGGTYTVGLTSLPNRIPL